MKIIDTHVHVVQEIAGTGGGGELRPIGGGRAMYADGSILQLIPPQFGEYQVTPEAVLKEWENVDVEKGVLLQGNYLGFQNLYAYEAQQKYPDRFLAAGTYDPFSRKCEAIKKHLFEDLGMRVVKFEVSCGAGLMANHETLPLDGDFMEKEYAYADDLGLIFVIDIGKLGTESCQVEALRRVILRHSGMTFVVCHLLAPSQDKEKEMCEAIARLALPNVWFDLASLSHNVRPDVYPFPVTRRFAHSAMKVVGADRLLFGTDLPSNLCRFTYRELIDCYLEDPDLTQAEKQLILHDNAERVFWGK